jgi:CopG family nickel-responsive transcriptional regulator
MSDILRFTVSMEEELLKSFEVYCSKQQFPTRSEAVRQLIREKLTRTAWDDDSRDAAASLTLVYDHHRAKLTDKMIEIQHTHSECVVSAMHVHLTHDLCMEMIALRGPAGKLRQLAAELSGLKGIHQAELVVVKA